jgi:tRNA(Ile)-lysidine synthase
MASSRKATRGKSARGLSARVAAQLAPLVEPGNTLLLGLSGGIDSIVLLDVLAGLQARFGYALRAMHVDHQLSPHSAAWSRFCRKVCRERGVPCAVRRVRVERGNSTESAAREARYAALRGAGADLVVLAHNADDQSETVLLQLLRGAGVKGLAAMPVVRRPSGATAWVRPLLDVARADIEAYARRRKLAWIEDESNASSEYLRNWLRHEILPRLADRVPAYRAVLGRTAGHCAEAAELLDVLARSDGGDGGELTVARLKTLSAARARNVVRFAIASRGWRMPEARRLDEALRQALRARADARIEVDLGDCTLRRHRDALHLVGRSIAQQTDLAIEWRGEAEIALPALGGVLSMPHRRGAGVSLERLQAERVTIRSRRGGERIKPAADRPTRTVKNLLQEARVAAWERDRLPFIYCGDDLACIPGVAVDYRFQARPGEASIVPAWRPADLRGGIELRA